MGIFKGLKTALSNDGSLAEYWNRLTDEKRIDDIIEESYKKPQLIYKHSNRCSTCWFSKSELENSAGEISSKASMHFVDVVASRSVSNKLAEVLNVRHESPQAILVKDGKAVWDTSHGSIKGKKVLDQLK